MYVVFCYDDEKWVSGLRKNAFSMCNNKCDALRFPNLQVATEFVSVLRVLYPDIYFRIFPFSE